MSGLRERWGRDVLHCPYCHGWEVRDHAIGVLATGPLFAKKALLFRQWSSDVTPLLHTQPSPNATEAECLAARGIPVVEGVVEGLDVVDDRLTGVRLQGGRGVPMQALVVAPRSVANGAVLCDLGLTPAAHPTGIGEMITADPSGLTDVPGVWVAGNVTDLTAQVLGSAAGGAAAAAAINLDLIEDDIRRAVADHGRGARSSGQLSG